VQTVAIDEWIHSIFWRQLEGFQLWRSAEQVRGLKHNDGLSTQLLTAYP